jgi:hypothetical protein
MRWIPPQHEKNTAREEHRTRRTPHTRIRHDENEERSVTYDSMSSGSRGEGKVNDHHGEGVPFASKEGAEEGAAVDDTSRVAGEDEKSSGDAHTMGGPVTSGGDDYTAVNPGGVSP